MKFSLFNLLDFGLKKIILAQSFFLLDCLEFIAKYTTEKNNTKTSNELL